MLKVKSLWHKMLRKPDNWPLVDVLHVKGSAEKRPLCFSRFVAHVGTLKTFLDSII